MVDKNFESADKIFIPIFDLNDFYLIEYAKRFINNNNSQVVILDAVGKIQKNVEIRELIKNIERLAPNHISLYQSVTIEKDFIEEMDLMLITHNSWKKLIESKSLWLTSIPSTLIISE